MQLDSHHHFVKDWDTKCIQMLHSSDAGEYSVLSSYAPGYSHDDYSDINSILNLMSPIISGIRVNGFTDEHSGIIEYRSFSVSRNEDKITKPFESP